MPVTSRSLRRHNNAMTRATAAFMAGAAGIGSAAWGISQFVTPYRANVAKTSEKFPADDPILSPVVNVVPPVETGADPVAGYDIDAALASVSNSMVTLADTVTSTVTPPASGGGGGLIEGNGGGPGLVPPPSSLVPGLTPKDDNGPPFDKPEVLAPGTVSGLPVVCETVTQAVTPSPAVPTLVDGDPAGCEPAPADAGTGTTDPASGDPAPPADSGTEPGHTRSRGDGPSAG